MMPKFVFLATDWVLLCLLGFLVFYLWHVFRTEELRARWRFVVTNGLAVTALVFLSTFLLVSVVDSIHYRPLVETHEDGTSVYDVKLRSLLDDLLPANSQTQEKSYSTPLAIQTFEKISRLENNKPIRDFEPLKTAGAHLTDRADHWKDVSLRASAGGAVGLGGGVVLSLLISFLISRKNKISWKKEVGGFFKKGERVPYEYVLLTITVLLTLAGAVAALWPYYHVFGTDQTGNDILYQAIKSIRTAIIIGSLATLAMLPFAVLLGISAGYFKGKTDDVIQYIYTTLSSIPSVLLIAASVLMIQVFIDTHPDLYETGMERADVRLFILALIIGMTGWATLARLLRAETLKISQLDYVQAARAFGVGHFSIMRRHIFPNVIHIVLIVVVLDFSSIVLYEAVLSYVGVGVDPTTYSFGSMINAGRLELSRTPVIWWNLAVAFVFMLTLVLSANLFASSVRDAFDPRLALKTRKAKEDKNAAH